MQHTLLVWESLGFFAELDLGLSMTGTAAAAVPWLVNTKSRKPYTAQVIDGVQYSLYHLMQMVSLRHMEWNSASKFRVQPPVRCVACGKMPRLLRQIATIENAEAKCQSTEEDDKL